MDKKSNHNSSASFEDAQGTPEKFDDCEDQDQEGK